MEKYIEGEFHVWPDHFLCTGLTAIKAVVFMYRWNFMKTHNIKVTMTLFHLCDFFWHFSLLCRVISRQLSWEMAVLCSNLAFKTKHVPSWLQSTHTTPIIGLEFKLNGEDLEVVKVSFWMLSVVFIFCHHHHQNCWHSHCYYCWC